MHVGRFGFIILWGALMLGFNAGPGAQESNAAPQLYAKGATWQDTMLSARAKYQAWQKEQLAGQALNFGPWFITEPIKVKGFSDPSFPEQKVKLDATLPDGRRVWSERRDLMDGIPHSLPAQSPASLYLYRVINAPAACTLHAGLGSDDGAEVWLNDAKVLSNNTLRLAAKDSDLLDLPLIAGENRLLVKVFNASGGSGFYFSLRNDPVAALWGQIEQDFPRESAWLKEDNREDTQLYWFISPDNKPLQNAMINRALEKGGEVVQPLRQRLAELDNTPDDPGWLNLYVTACKFRQGMRDLDRVDFPALRLAIQDMAKTFPDRCKNSDKLLSRVDECEKQLPEVMAALGRGDDAVRASIDKILALQAEALLANPLLDFDRLLLVKRNENAIGLPQNWQGNCAIPARGYDNEIATLSPIGPSGTLSTFYKPQDGAFVGDIDLNFDADKMLFSMAGSHDRWQIWEIGSDGTGLHQVTPGEEPDVDNYDACYLPDGRITFGSTRCFQGVPCVGGGNTVANLCRMDADGTNVRQALKQVTDTIPVRFDFSNERIADWTN